MGIRAFLPVFESPAIFPAFENFQRFILPHLLFLK